MAGVDMVGRNTKSRATIRVKFLIFLGPGGNARGFKFQTPGTRDSSDLDFATPVRVPPW